MGMPPGRSLTWSSGPGLLAPCARLGRLRICQGGYLQFGWGGVLALWRRERSVVVVVVVGTSRVRWADRSRRSRIWRRARVRRRPSVVMELCLPQSTGTGWRHRCRRPYCGGVDPDLVADAGLGVKGDAFYSSYRGEYTRMRAVGDGLDMDAGVAAPGGGPLGWLSGGQPRGGGDFLSWSCGRRDG